MGRLALPLVLLLVVMTAYGVTNRAAGRRALDRRAIRRLRRTVVAGLCTAAGTLMLLVSSFGPDLSLAAGGALLLVVGVSGLWRLRATAPAPHPRG
jgi:hypothetical protein